MTAVVYIIVLFVPEAIISSPAEALSVFVVSTLNFLAVTVPVVVMLPEVSMVTSPSRMSIPPKP